MKSLQQLLIPYTNSAQQALYSPGYRQSFSGSETDVSTSTENLTLEEKHVLQNSIREEPQGEEQLVNTQNLDSSPGSPSDIKLGSGYKNLQLPSSVEVKTTNSNTFYVTGNMQRNTGSPKGGGNRGVAGGGCGRPSPENLLKRSNESGLTGQMYNFLLSKDSKINFGQSFGDQYSITGRTREIANIPEHYLDQSEVLKHLAKEVEAVDCVDFSHLPPPPEYPKYRSPQWNFKKLFEKGQKHVLSRSQPDLSRAFEDGGSKIGLSQRPKTRGRASVPLSVESDYEAIATRAQQMVEILSEENSALRAEMEVYFRKVSRLQKFDMELQKVHQSHEDLIRSAEKRERLERAIRAKLEMELHKSLERNRELKEQLEAASLQLSKRQSHNVYRTHEYDDSEIRKEINKRDIMIAQLITQNKELVATKERYEIELAAQRATLQEQRTHIDVLDNALTNAQSNVVKLEEECRKKQAYVDRVNQLQKALASLQIASDKREQMEKKLRTQLEKEVEALRAQKEGKQSEDLPDGSIPQLKRILREKEERILALEADLMKWEQKFLEESAMRQLAIDAASMPKDARIAALEKTSHESEKLIAQARSEKLKHMDELYSINRHCADMEARAKELESKLAEKDAMIKVLQRHSMEKDVAFQNAMLRSPRHSPRPSQFSNPRTPIPSENKSPMDNNLSRSLSGSLMSQLGSKEETEASIKVNSTTQAQEKKELDEQLRELDSRISNQDSIINALRAEKEKYPSHYWQV